MTTEERDSRFNHRMSDSEALMWHVEEDPWLNPNGAALTILDAPIDADHFDRTIRAAVAALPRLYERVVPGIGRMASPVWVPDAEFELDFHVRRVRLPSPGTERQLFDLATQLYLEPFDRTRPLWRYVLIDGLEGGGSAVWTVLHHVVADGIGQLRMIEKHQQLTRDAPPPDEVDLDAIIAADAEEHAAHQIAGDLGESLFESTVGSLSDLAKRQLDNAKRLAEEVATWPTDPGRARTAVDDVVTATKSTVGAVLGTGDEVAGGSPIWTQRSRHRHLEAVRASLGELKAVSKRLDVTVNDLFLAGVIEGAVRYHADRGVEVDAFNTSFVLSTRHDAAVGGNSFTPVPVQLPGQPMPLADRVADISVRLAEKRAGMSHGGGFGALSGVAKLLPTTLVTRATRSRAAHIDVATSNMRGSPVPLYISGARIVELIAMGPVAGTACNATAISHEDVFGIGLFVDPMAIESPGDHRDAVEQAMDELVAL